MNDAQVLERLVDSYATVPAPAPSAELRARMDAGRVGDDDRRDACVVPLVRRPARTRARYLVAAMVATFVAFSGLAAAGALPDPVQRGLSSLMAHVGIDVPTPADPGRPPISPALPGAAALPAAPDQTGSPSSAGGSGAASATTAPAATAPSATTVPATTAPAGAVAPTDPTTPTDPSTPVTLPPLTGDDGLLPPSTGDGGLFPPLTGDGGVLPVLPIQLDRPLLGL